MEALLSVLLICVFWGVVHPFRTPQKSPHIIFILVDDMGWYDVSFHGSDQIPTPNIDSLAYHGVILNRHYTQPLCTPSRAALMTGKYPVHTGLHDALYPSHKAGLNLTEKLLPEYLKELGYSTHIIGKWHLGFFNNKYIPLSRGFDSFFGYYGGAISYYDHVCEDLVNVPPNKYKYSGHDLRRNQSSAWDLVGHYATDLFTTEAVRVIRDHPSSKPLFLYLPHLAVHAGNEGKWLEAPQHEINRFSYISDPNRRTYAAMVSKLDQSIGAVIKALDSKNMLSNSIIAFVSDNGAPIEGVYKTWGSNYPFRGQKLSLWEGGVRTPVAVWSPLIKNPSRVSKDLMHITDWLPTLLSAAGYDDQDLQIDGINQWMTISDGFPSLRHNLVVDIDDSKDMTAMVIDSYKYLKGPIPANFSPELNKFLSFHNIISKGAKYRIEELTGSLAWKALQKYSKDPNLKYKVEKLRQDAQVQCEHKFDEIMHCDSKPCLFDLASDPCENNNIAHYYPDAIKYFENLIDFYRQSSVNITLRTDPDSNPDFFNGTWSPWEKA